MSRFEDPIPDRSTHGHDSARDAWLSHYARTHPLWPQHAQKCRKRRPSVFKPVRCVDTGEVFPSLTAAAEAFHFSPGGIIMAMEAGRPIRGVRFERVAVKKRVHREYGKTMNV